MVALLPLNVLPEMVAVFWLKTPPPSCAELPGKVLVVTDSVPLLSIAPPEPPVVAGEELPVNVLPGTDPVPRLYMRPPPPRPQWWDRPLLSVSELSVSVPPGDTSKIRKAAVAGAVDRVMVAPLPRTVTLPVMTAGRCPGRSCCSPR